MTTADYDRVLAAIDGALTGDTSPDAMRWTPEPVTAARIPTPYPLAHLEPGELVLTDAQARAIAEAGRRFGQAMVDLAAQLATHLTALGAALNRIAAAMPAPPPTPAADPRAHALELRQHRNTGPAERYRPDGTRVLAHRR